MAQPTARPVYVGGITKHSGISKSNLHRIIKGGLKGYSGAEPLLEQAVALQPDHYDACYNLGFVLAKLGKPPRHVNSLQLRCSCSPAVRE